MLKIPNNRAKNTKHSTLEQHISNRNTPFERPFSFGMSNFVIVPQTENGTRSCDV